MKMPLQKSQNFIGLLFLFVSVSIIPGCLSTRKMDRFVSEQYNHQIPKQNYKKAPGITVTYINPSPNDVISSSERKTSKVLPLLFYWEWDYRHTSTLNPSIPVNNFANNICAIANRGLNQKLNGQKLALTVEQAPTTFALVDEAHLIWVVYAISWDKLYVEPDAKDLIVSYTLTNEGVVKSGKIVIENKDENKNIRFFQSWRSSTSEYLTRYNQNIKDMTKEFVDKLMEEI